jgi:hypothetical protein
MKASVTVPKIVTSSSDTHSGRVSAARGARDEPRQLRRTAEMGGYLPLAPGISDVRYPIPERIFDYVSTVRSATAGTCHNRTSLAAKFVNVKGGVGYALSGSRSAFGC